VLLALAPLALALATPAPEPEIDAATQATLDATMDAMIASAERDEAEQKAENPPEDWSNPDPFEPINRVFYAINQPIDGLILRPAAIAYKTIMPKPARDGIHNALENIFIPTVLANDIVQLRPRRAARTLARFAINSTLGLGGLFDVARRKPFNIPAHPNSLSDTLGVMGIESGAYLYLPFLGPTTFRDLVGLVGDAFTQPLLLDRVPHQQVTTVRNRKRFLNTEAVTVSTQGLVVLLVNGVGERGRADADLQALKKQSVDPYASLRSSYLQNREGEIARVKAKDGAQIDPSELDDPLADPAAPQPAR